MDVGSVKAVNLTEEKRGHKFSVFDFASTLRTKAQRGQELLYSEGLGLYLSLVCGMSE